MESTHEDSPESKKRPLLPPSTRDEIVDHLRRAETLKELLKSAAVSSYELEPATISEAAHMIGEELDKLRRVLGLS